MTTQLTDADRFELVTATYDGQRADEPEDHTDTINIDRWSKYGHDRLYINGLRCGDGHLDLKTGDSDGDRWTKVTADGDLDGDTLTIEIGNRSPSYILTVRVHGDGFETADEDGDDDSEDDTGAGSSTEPELVADGGVVEGDQDSDDEDAESADPKTIRDLGGRQADAVCRHYSADGHLYAYREDGEHVVVSNGNEPATRWTRRVPAERTAVTPGEHLWTIPDNWEQRVSIKGNADARYAIYHIPESDVDVEVSVPHNNHLVDAWYGVKSIGEVAVTYADACDWDALDRCIEQTRDIDAVGGDVVAALEELSRRSTAFERYFGKGVNEFAAEALLERAHGSVSLGGRTTDPWGDHHFDPDDRYVAEFLDIDGDLLDGVVRELDAVGVIPNYPEVEVSIDDSGQHPDGHGTRALIEAGCSPAETIDYYHTEVLDHSQTEWAGVRERGQSSVSGNVAGAKRTLKR